MSTNIIRKLIPTRADHRAARLLAVAALGLATVGGTATAAHADTGYSLTWSGEYLITASYDFQNVAVSNGALTGGAPIIQWPADGGYEQVWRFGYESYNGVYQGAFIQNAASGLCINTDGVAGDQLDQEICYDGNSNELFNIYGSLGGYDSFQNTGSGLYLDVNGYSWNEGAAIDLWYENNQPNQTFATVAW
ncbi:RICIN domain-containing protein [Actinospica sp. MGRD01-02]|uniref:RICIN domain-containing protein n=1 Tax=Actinospica acidithermotolerans TaxID=2828514 RepID=A0A941IK05_9ACTN|nr:RICIN domain-containing protein [Actinospica acidithermotolerans]MBR7828432.1 RICIN domain-containing protein [Actinospica acidithermotolerans]